MTPTPKINAHALSNFLRRIEILRVHDTGWCISIIFMVEHNGVPVEARVARLLPGENKERGTIFFQVGEISEDVDATPELHEAFDSVIANLPAHKQDVYNSAVQFINSFTHDQSS